MCSGNLDLKSLRIKHRIVGRGQELEAMFACLMAGRNVLLEGPVGVGKTILARAVSDALSRSVHRVDGDGRFTEQKLVGHFDPPGVMQNGYHSDAFLKGPLVLAMEEGGVLFINEINRMPEGVQNVLLPALDEGTVVLPLLGHAVATTGFAVIATMNPREFVATGHLSEALLDRFELVALDYQSAEEEMEIVNQHIRPPNPDPDLVRGAVQLVRATRSHPRIRRGASVRAAIALVEIARALAGPDGLRRAAALALPTRIELKEAEDRGLEALLSELIPEKKKVP